MNSHKKTEEKQVELPKVPFGLINLYQNLCPLTIIVFVNLGILYLVQSFSISPWIQVMGLPCLGILNYMLYIWSITQCSQLLNNYFEKKSTPQQGTFVRSFENGNVSSPILHYYHLRGFLYKWPVWVAKKSPFPWMLNMVLRDMAKNKIDKNFMYGDVYVGLELTTLAEGAVIMDGGIISSHVIDDLYGALTIKECQLKENAVMLPNSVITPGVTIDSKMSLGPNAFVPKSWMITDQTSNFIYGVPSKKKGYRSFMEVLPDAYQKAWAKKKPEE